MLKEWKTWLASSWQDRMDANITGIYWTVCCVCAEQGKTLVGYDFTSSFLQLCRDRCSNESHLLDKARMARDCQPFVCFHGGSTWPQCQVLPPTWSLLHPRTHDTLDPTMEIFLGGARPPILPGCYFLPLWAWRVSLLLLTFPSASLVWNYS